MKSEILKSMVFSVFLNPQLFSIYPRNLIFLNSVEQDQHLFCIGRGFNNLLTVEPRLRCKLKFDGRTQGIVQSVIYLEAIII